MNLLFILEQVLYSSFFTDVWNAVYNYLASMSDAEFYSTILIVIAAIIAFVETPFEQKVQELENEGYYVAVYDGSFDDAKTSSPEVDFEMTQDWNTFKEQVAATKQDFGFATVWIQPYENTLWVYRYEETCYYYKVG